MMRLVGVGETEGRRDSHHVAAVFVNSAGRDTNWNIA
jgi:hypothetical protein